MKQAMEPLGTPPGASWGPHLADQWHTHQAQTFPTFFFLVYKMLRPEVSMTGQFPWLPAGSQRSPRKAPARRGADGGWNRRLAQGPQAQPPATLRLPSRNEDRHSWEGTAPFQPTASSKGDGSCWWGPGDTQAAPKPRGAAAAAFPPCCHSCPGTAPGNKAVTYLLVFFCHPLVPVVEHIQPLGLPLP